MELRTSRLKLRPPETADAESIFGRYAGDPEVTKYLAWPRHQTIEDTLGFVRFSEAHWAAHGCGPLLVFDGAGLVGSTGLQFDSPGRAVTGYVLARASWGLGYATEALRAMIESARARGFRELDAFCHEQHRASVRVLEKCGFERIAVIDETFPNLSPPRAPALHYRLKVGAR